MPRFIGNLDHALSRLRTARQEPQQPPIQQATAITQAIPAPQRPLALREYAGSAIVHSRQSMPAFSTRLAQSQAIFTQPQFYSPLHTPQNWQIPSKRREIYQWCRYFTDNEPKVAAAIDFYSKFPMNGWEIQCDDPKIKRFFEHLCKQLKLDYWSKLISREHYMIGDVFPFLEINCNQCGGSSVFNGQQCRHPHGTFRRLVVMNPDWIDVQTSVMAEDPVITLLPDDELKRIVWHKQPKAIYDRIPVAVRNLIMSGRPIPLDNMAVSHLKFNPYPYGTYGTSLIRRLFKTLAYKDKLMTAQWIVAERLILPVRIVKVGNDERPAGPADIADVQNQLAQVANDPNLTLVTHHAFQYEWVGSSGKVLQLSNEYDLINKEVLQGLMINEALLSGEMGGYSSAAIGAEAIIQRMEEWRNDLKTWMEERIFKPVSQMKGFVDEEATKEIGKEIGEAVWIVPSIRWNDLHLRDKTQHDQTLMQLQERGLISAQTVLEKLDYDYDQEVERIRYETAAQSFGQMGQEGAGGAGGGGMGGLGGGGAGGLGGLDMGGPAPMGGGPPMGGPGEMAPPGGAGAPPAPGAAPGPMGAGSEGKVLKRSRQKLKQPSEEAAQPSNVRLTSLEQTMLQTITGMRLPIKFFAQYPLGPYRADFAFPALKLAVECDGAKWHSSPVDVAQARKRDSELAYHGWSVLRFGERDIKDRLPDVQYTLSTVINDLWNKAIARQKQMRAMQQKAMDGADMVRTAMSDDMHASALANREAYAKVAFKDASFSGILIQSLLEPFGNEELTKYASVDRYPSFGDGSAPVEEEAKAEAIDVDGNPDQGTRDTLV